MGLQVMKPERGYVLFTVGTKYVKSNNLMQLCMRFHKNYLGHYWLFSVKSHLIFKETRQKDLFLPYETA